MDQLFASLARSPRVGLLPPITAEAAGSPSRAPVCINYGHYHLGSRAPLEALCAVEDDVEEIDLEANALPSKTLRRLLRMMSTMPRLTVLNLSHNTDLGTLEPCAFAALIEGCRTLAVLKLANCALTLPQVDDLCAQLARVAGRTPLYHVDLSANKLGEHCVPGVKVSTKWIQILMSRSRALTHLDLSRNALSGSFARAVSIGMRDTLIETLLLSGNAFGADSAGDFLAHAIGGSNASLQTLDLTRNGLGCAPALIFANALWASSTLTTLTLAHNPIGSLGARALLRAVATKPEDIDHGWVESVDMDRVRSKALGMLKKKAPWKKKRAAEEGVGSRAANTIVLLRTKKKTKKKTTTSPKKKVTAATKLTPYDLRHERSPSTLSRSSLSFSRNRDASPATRRRSSSSSSGMSKFGTNHQPRIISAPEPMPPFDLSISQCECRWPYGRNQTAEPVEFIDPASEPAGRYELDLGNPLRWAVAMELVRLKRRFPLCFSWRKGGGAAAYKAHKGRTRILPEISTVDEETGVETEGLITVDEETGETTYWSPPSSGTLTMDVTYSRLALAEDHAVSSNQLDSLLHATREVLRGNAINLIVNVMPDLVLKCVEGRRLYKSMDASNDEEARKLVDSIYPHIVDDLPGFLASSVPMRHLEVMRASFGQLLTFDHTNPNGRYVIDLTRPGDRTVLRSLIAMNNKEKKLRVRARLADTSQRARSGDNFRNVVHYEPGRSIGKPFVIKGSTDRNSTPLPRYGEIRLDYVSTVPTITAAGLVPEPIADAKLWLTYISPAGVPYKPDYPLEYFANIGTICAEPVKTFRSENEVAPADEPDALGVPAWQKKKTDPTSEEKLARLTRDDGLGSLSPSKRAPGPGAIMALWRNIKDKLTSLRRVLSRNDIWITAKQAATIALAFPSFGGARVTALQMLWGRTCGGEERMKFPRAAFDVLPAQDDCLRLAARIGWLNLLHEDDIDHRYFLDLSKRDERIVAQHLARLSTERGENWIDEGYCKKRTDDEKAQRPWSCEMPVKSWELQGVYAGTVWEREREIEREGVIALLSPTVSFLTFRFSPLSSLSPPTSSLLNLDSWVNSDGVPRVGYVWLTQRSPAKKHRDDSKRWRMQRTFLSGDDAHVEWMEVTQDAIEMAKEAVKYAEAEYSVMWAVSQVCNVLWHDIVSAPAPPRLLTLPPPPLPPLSFSYSLVL